MMFQELLAALHREHWFRNGVYFSRPFHRLLWEPWVREFLRTYEAPRVAMARRATP